MKPIRAAATPADYLQIANLANTIWREHYIPIIGKPQVDYMLEKFQSAEAIKEQVRRGMSYFLLEIERKPCGYFAFEKRGDDLFLSKIYVLKSERGKGLGKAAMDYLRQAADRMKCKRISLTVNKDNSRSIAAYIKMGFLKGPGTIKDIGDGFIMDDYLMILNLADAPEGAID
jgi:GNAT superfamily N-acetyltransferase